MSRESFTKWVTPGSQIDLGYGADIRCMWASEGSVLIRELPMMRSDSIDEPELADMELAAIARRYAAPSRAIYFNEINEEQVMVTRAGFRIRTVTVVEPVPPLTPGRALLEITLPVEGREGIERYRSQVLDRIADRLSTDVIRRHGAGAELGNGDAALSLVATHRSTPEYWFTATQQQLHWLAGHGAGAWLGLGCADLERDLIIASGELRRIVGPQRWASGRLPARVDFHVNGDVTVGFAKAHGGFRTPVAIAPL